MRHSVAVLGGGVGGLSAAHELAERGFSVSVYERQATFGGKARSMSVPGTGTGGRKDLPGEHGFRFFPGFYKHITDTMRRIPFGDGGRDLRRQSRPGDENPAGARRQARPRLGRADPGNAGRFPDRVSRAVRQSRHPASRDRPFVTRLLGLATSCEERYLAEFEHMPFWDFIGARTRSDNYQQVSRPGHDALARRDARRGQQHADRRAHPVAALLRHPRARGRVRPPADRPDQRRLDRSVATAPDRTPWRGAGPERDAPIAQSRRRPVAQRHDRTGRTARRGDGGLLRRRGAGRGDARLRHARDRARGAVAVEARRAADRMDERHPVLSRDRSAAGRRPHDLSRFELGAHLDLAAPVLARLRPVAVRQRTRGRHPVGRHLELDGARATSTASRRWLPRRARRSRTRCGRS